MINSLWLEKIVFLSLLNRHILLMSFCCDSQIDHTALSIKLKSILFQTIRLLVIFVIIKANIYSSKK